jgi:hypothetical protein
MKILMTTSIANIFAIRLHIVWSVAVIKEDAAEAQPSWQADQSKAKPANPRQYGVNRAAGSVSKALKGMWDELLNIGRPDAIDICFEKCRQSWRGEKRHCFQKAAPGLWYSYDTSSNDQEYDAPGKALNICDKRFEGSDRATSASRTASGRYNASVQKDRG